MYLFIITTIIGFLSVHSSYISKFILRWCNRLTSKERELLNDRTKLKDEQAQLSNVRDFVRYSKLQRNINRIEEELKALKGEKPTNSFVFNIGLEYSMKVVVGIMMLYMTLAYRKVPVFIVDSKYDLFPFGGLISFPNDIVNSVSVHFWMICCGSVAKLLVK